MLFRSPVNTNTTSVTSPETTAVATNTVTATETNPIKTETISPTTSETAKTNTVSTTETVSPAITETKTETSTPPETTTTSKTETTTQPTTTEAATTTTKTESENLPTTSSAILKYYDVLFDKLDLSGATYSASKPIPVDAPMPEGLIFKVQIGAFRNPIPQNLFKGIKPITAETTPQGLKRYTAGLFEKFLKANDAKKQVNGLGYRDAFIVAFFNGKRISMNEALAKAKENGETIDAATLASSSSVSTSTSSSTTESATNTANATDVKSVSGLLDRKSVV